MRDASSLPPLEVLYKLRRERPDVFDKLEGELSVPPASKFCALTRL